LGCGKRVYGVAVCAESARPVPPCGGCRQKLAEFANDDCPVFVADSQGLRVTHRLADLLPFAFGPQYLAP
jgi:cytidine deaminase